MAESPHSLERKVASQDLAGALSLALEAWQESHAPEVAEVVAVLTRDVLAAFPEPKVKTKVEFQVAWLKASSQPGPVMTGWLAANLTRWLPVEPDHFGVLDPNYAQRKYAALFARLARLGERVPDPRIAEALTRFLIEAPSSAWDRRAARLIYGPVMDLVVRCGDVRQLPLLTDLLANPRAPRASTREELEESLPSAIEALRRVPIAMGTAERAAWRRLVPAARNGPPEREATGEQLLEAVLAHPDDDGPRLVYADWLQERGDDRGELIALQVAESRGQASAGDQRRIRSLLRAHRNRWLGDLAFVLTHVELRRGFLDSGVVASNAAATSAVWARAPHQAALRTLRLLRQGRGNVEHYAALVASPMAENLRAVEIPVGWLLESLCQGPLRRLEELHFHRLPNVARLRLVARSAALPHLRHLSFPLEDNQEARLVAMLKESGVLSRRVRLTVRPHWTSSVVSVLHSLRRDLFDAELVSELAVRVRGGECILSRRASGVHVQLEDRQGHLAPQFLEAIPELASVEARGADHPRSARPKAAPEGGPVVRCSPPRLGNGT